MAKVAAVNLQTLQHRSHHFMYEEGTAFRQQCKESVTLHFYYLLLTCVALLLDLCEGPMAMLTLDEDCVSVVLPPSAADNPEMTRPLEKLRFPNNRLRVDEDEETWGEGSRWVLNHNAKKIMPPEIFNILYVCASNKFSTTTLNKWLKYFLEA